MDDSVSVWHEIGEEINFYKEDRPTTGTSDRWPLERLKNCNEE